MVFPTMELFVFLSIVTVGIATPQKTEISDDELKAIHKPSGLDLA